MICDVIDASDSSERQHHTFRCLGLTSKICRSYTTRYMFRRVLVEESLGNHFDQNLRDCMVTLERLDVLHLVERVDLILSLPWTSMLLFREIVVEFVKKLPNLSHLYIRAFDILSPGLTDELDEILADRCCQVHNNDWGPWWQWCKRWKPARVSGAVPK
jgi:hypothetical protein